MSETNTPTPSPYEYPTTVDVPAVLAKVSFLRGMFCGGQPGSLYYAVNQALDALEAQVWDHAKYRHVVTEQFADYEREIAIQVKHLRDRDAMMEDLRDEIEELREKLQKEVALSNKCQDGLAKDYEKVVSDLSESRDAQKNLVIQRDACRERCEDYRLTVVFLDDNRGVNAFGFELRLPTEISATIARAREGKPTQPDEARRVLGVIAARMDTAPCAAAKLADNAVQRL